jgi:Domain of unknown function (DUF2017)
MGDHAAGPLMRRRGPITRTRDGDFRLRLAPEERDVLRGLPDQLRRLLTEDDPALVRLFPPAYVDDIERDAEYRRLMREELVNRRLESLAMVEATVDAERLTEEQLNSWMKVINDLRLVIGTSLDVQEDDDPGQQLDPGDASAPMRAMYWFLSYLLESTIDALSDR